MYRIYTQTALTATLAAFAFAQAPQNSTPPATQRSTAQEAATAGSSDSNSYRGVLMDASCKAIQDRTASSVSSNATRSRAAGASASTSATTSATTGVATDQSGQATATKETTPPTEARSTATASGSSSNTNRSGATTTEANISDAAATGDRNRASHTSPDSKWMTVREKYKDCKVTPTTTSFAIMADGQLYMIDDTGGSVRQRMSSNTSSDFHTVTVTGSMNGDRLVIKSIQ